MKSRYILTISDLMVWQTHKSYESEIFNFGEFSIPYNFNVTFSCMLDNGFNHSHM